MSDPRRRRPEEPEGAREGRSLCFGVSCLIRTGLWLRRGEGNDKSLPAMKGLDMSVVSHEAPTLALDQEERFQSAQEAQLARISKLLPSV